jgi:hypothetical protein
VGLGSMMAGGNPAEGRQDDDFYATPPEATQAFLSFYGPFLEGYRRFYEPCCGNGAMAEVVTERFPEAEMEATDLVPRGYGMQASVFDIPPFFGSAPEVVITNPPFNLAEPIIRHVMGNWKPRVLALLLKSTYWHAAERTALFDEYRPSMILALPWRLDFMGQGRPTMEMSWFIWDQDRPSPIGYPVYRIAPNLNPKKRKAKSPRPSLPIRSAV